MPEARSSAAPDDDEPRRTSAAPAPGTIRSPAAGVPPAAGLTGDYETDVFGFDPDLTDHVLLPALRPLFSRWFRVETHGVGERARHRRRARRGHHSGTRAARRDDGNGRAARRPPGPAPAAAARADLVFDLPVIGSLSRKLGSTLACNEDAERC
jgi:hypothetical protein